MPTVSFTGYGAKYEACFEAPAGEELFIKRDTLTLTEAGANPNKLTATVTHTPVTRTVVVTPEIPAVDSNGDGIIDPSAGDIAAIPAVTKEVGVLDAEGKQTYAHTAEFTYADSVAANAIAGGITRLRDEVSSTETVTGAATLLAGDTATFVTTTGANVSLILDARGALKCQINDTTAGAIESENYPKAVFNGADSTCEVEFIKSVTHARQDHSAKSLQIKINTWDDIAANGITNDSTKPGEPYVPPTPPTPVTPEITPISSDEEEPEEPAKSVEPDIPAKPAKPKESDEPKEPETEVPRTGDNMKIYSYMFLALCGGAGLIYGKKTRKRGSRKAFRKMFYLAIGRFR